MQTNRRQFLQAMPLALTPNLVGASESEPSFTLLMTGDIELDNTPGALIARGGDPFLHIESVLHSADVVVGNLECVVATIGEPIWKPYTFRAHPRVIPHLKKHFDALSLANNHTGDFGKPALVECLERLKEAGIPTFGAGRNLEEAHKPWLIEKNGIKLALLGYNEFKPASFAAGANIPGVAWSSGKEQEARVIADIQAAKKIADVVIPFMHWGWEDEPANERQMSYGLKLVEAGADAVIGSHPHCTQGFDIFHDKLVLFSLGNLVFDEFKDRDGWLVKLTITKQGVRKWQTIVVRTNEQGTPRVMKDVESPYGVLPLVR
jgi:poly-gamma-glutamate capsule biosynthesis protein CapA/YwtB (metallophosphatase superfamily)